MLAGLVFSPLTVAAQAPDLLSNFEVNLTEKEKEALRLAAEWSDREAKPVHLGNGKVVYVLGATMPTVIAAPMHISDIELQIIVNTAIAGLDLNGKIMPQTHLTLGLIPQGKVFLVSRHAGGFDSRYFGLVDEAKLTKYRSLITF